MKTKKLLALILSTLMIISALPTNIFAAPSAVTVGDTAQEIHVHEEHEEHEHEHAHTDEEATAELAAIIDKNKLNQVYKTFDNGFYINYDVYTTCKVCKNYVYVMNDYDHSIYISSISADFSTPGNAKFTFVFTFFDCTGQTYTSVPKTQTISFNCAEKVYPTVFEKVNGQYAYAIIRRDASSHTGGNPTCLASANCTRCNAPYTVDHSYSSSYTQVVDGSTYKHRRMCNYGCGNYVDDAACSGGKATCKDKAVCTVCKNSYGNFDTTNHDSKSVNEENGFYCAHCKLYEQPSTTNINGVTYYEIDNAGKLYWFAQAVNNGNTAINAVLTNDIVINEGNVSGCGGTMADGWFNWTPIGVSNSSFTGTFDGKEHTVSGIYGVGKNENNQGLFGIAKGTIKNVGVINSYFDGIANAGGVVGGMQPGGIIENCYNAGSVKGGQYVGGVAGFSGATVRNCYNTGYVGGNNNPTGGVVGHIVENANIENCYNTGNVSGSGTVGGVVGNMSNGVARARNCYNIGSVSGSGTVGGVAASIDTASNIENGYFNSENFAGNAVGKVRNGAVTDVDAFGKTSAEFASGEVAYLLNNGVTDGTQAYYQTVGEGIPTFEGKTVYYGYESCATTEDIYSNTELNLTLGHFDNDDNHLCDDCGEMFSECADEDNDHLCDVCGEIFSECADEDSDHFCDICGEKLSECADEDGDNICDICGNLIQIIISMTDSYGNGWNGAAIEIYINGTLAETVTVDVDTNTVSLPYDGTSVYTFKWINGEYDRSCSFVISCGGKVLKTVDFADSLSYGETILHIIGAKHEHSVSEPCGVCSNCLGVCGTDFVHSFDENNGFCIYCDAYEPAVLNGDNVYEISNAGQLYWFAEQVNVYDNNHFHARLVKDIYVNNDLTAENLREWTPIGRNGSSYIGSFDGNGYSISGLYFNNPDVDYVGLFGRTEYGYFIENIHIKNSYFNGNNYVGALCGNALSFISYCTASADVTVRGKNYVGGLLGGTSTGELNNCYSLAAVDADGLVGGLVGSNYLAISNCYTNQNSIYGSNYASVENSYYLSEEETEDGGKTAVQFENGEVAYLLQSGIVGEPIYDEEWNEIGTSEPEQIWGQDLSEENSLPELGGKKVYYGYADCTATETTYSNTELNETLFEHKDENDDHICDVCDEMFSECADEDSDHLCDICGEMFSECADEDGDNICDICGNLIQIIISMTDSFGDGWNGAGIEIYINGTLAETVTVDVYIDADTNTVSLPYDGTSVYTFKWRKGNYDNECSFVISCGGKVLKTVDSADGLSKGETILHIIGAKHEHSVSEPCGVCSNCLGVCGTDFIHVPDENYACAICAYSDFQALVISNDGTPSACFETIEAAILEASANENSTLKLLDDVNVNYACQIDDGKFTIDLNGKTWQSTQAVIIINGASEIEICDSSENADGMITTRYFSAINLLDESKLEIVSGNFSCFGERVIDMSYNGSETSSELLISGGWFECYCAVKASGRKVTVTGGVFECPYGCLFDYAYGTLDISNYNGTSVMSFFVPYYTDITALELILPEGAIFRDFYTDEIVTELLKGYEYKVDFAGIPSIEIDLGARSDYTNVRYAEIGGVVTAVEENDDKYTCQIGEENLLIEFVEKTAEGEVVKSQYFYVDMEAKTATCLGMESYIHTYDETSIRTSGEMGIRFKSHILTSAKSEDVEFEIDEYGYIITTADALGDDELTFDFNKYVTGVGYNKADGTDIVFDSTNDEYDVFTGVLKNVPVKNYGTDLVCKTYTKITVDGNQFTLYGEAVTGNIYDTAEKLLETNPADEDLIKIMLDYEGAIGLPGDDLYPEQ